MLGKSGEKTLPTKQAYFGGAFNLKGKFQITQGQSGSCIRFQTKGDVLERTKRFQICTLRRVMITSEWKCLKEGDH